MKKVIATAVLCLCLISSVFSQVDNIQYVDPTIGNVARFLVPTLDKTFQDVPLFPVENGIKFRFKVCQ